jgi:N-acetylmuramoyl-L-alanine amidase
MRWIAAALLASLACASTALAAGAAADRPAVTKVRFGVDTDRTRIVIESDQPFDYFTFTLAEQGARLVVDLERADFQLNGQILGDGQHSGDGVGLVAGYRWAQFSPTRSRIVFDLAAPAGIKRQFRLGPAPGATADRLVIDLESIDAASFRDQAGFPSDRVPDTAAPAETRRADAGRDRIVVALDPGHGGHDVGVPRPDRTDEKDVNLALARVVRDRLEATGRYRVVMTRDSDRYLTLEDRVRIARDAHAQLFLSLHADSAPSASTRGASVYKLAASAESRVRTEILADDPRIFDIDLSAREADVADIMVDLTRNDARYQSEVFARTLIGELDQVTPLVRNTLRDKNLGMLLAPDMPAVLLEAGFLTNPQDEALLNSPDHRGRLADALVKGINSYFEHRARLYADNGSR